MIRISYSPTFVRSFFDGFAKRYAHTSYLSLGLDNYIRRRALEQLNWCEGMAICDMMSGSGNNFSLINRLTNNQCHITAVDFSHNMNLLASSPLVTIKEENALQTSITDNSMDIVVCSFGLKTLDKAEYGKFAAEIKRILKPKGQFMLMELSIPKNIFARLIQVVHLQFVIPLLVTLTGSRYFHQCYLYPYIKAFKNMDVVQHAFEQTFHDVNHFSLLNGMVTGIIGAK